MVNFNCSHCGIKSHTKKLRVEMKEILLSRGFKFVGSCACNCGHEEAFAHDNHPGLRIHICPGRFWVKQKTPPNVNWSTIDFGAVRRFEEALMKYFTVK